MLALVLRRSTPIIKTNKSIQFLIIHTVHEIFEHSVFALTLHFQLAIIGFLGTLTG